MKLYHKINSIYKRDEKTNKFIVGQFANEETEYLKDLDWEWTEKFDGTNVRIGWNEDDKLRIGGRSENSQMPITLIEALNEILPEENIRKVFPDCSRLVLYGEGVGAKIQKGGGNYKSDGQTFVLFDVRVGDWLLKREDVDDVADKLEIKSTSVVSVESIDSAIERVKSEITSTWGDFNAEGLVGVPKGNLYTRRGYRIITKLKIKDFLN